MSLNRISKYTYCCPKLQTMLKEEEIEKVGDTYFISGKPLFVDDGDGRFDNMTGKYQINYCPFCGKKLQ